MSKLFSPYQMGTLQLDNRIVIPPMCQYSATEGVPSAWHTVHYGSLAQSGASLLIVEATAVTPEGRISPADLGIWNEAQEIGFKQLLEEIKHYSPIKMGIQLAHAGRKASMDIPWNRDRQLSIADGGWQTVAPSALPFNPEDSVPHALSETEISEHIEAFVTAALRAERAGFELLELHGAHGYLLHEFLSPLSNQRTDRYGGNFENRIRFLMEVFTAVRERVSSKVAVGVRISATDWVEGGWNLEESIELTRHLKAKGADFIHVSTGALSLAQQIPVKPLYQVPFAKAIKEETELTTIAVGLITTAAEAESVLTTQSADLVAIGRGMLLNPRWGWIAAHQLGDEVVTAPQYGAIHSILDHS